jgi:O-antigen ligase
VKPSFRADPAELLMLAGAAIAPFNFFLGVSISGFYLRPLHLWAFGAALFMIALHRDDIADGVDAPVLAFGGMFAFILLATILATPPEYKTRGIADVALLALNVLGFAAIRCYYVCRPAAWMRFFQIIGLSSVCMSASLIVRGLLAAKSGVVAGVDSYALGLGTVAGTYTATFAAAATAGMLFATDRRTLLLAVGAFIVHGVAMLLSLARGPWLAFVAAILAMIPLAAWRFRGRFTVTGTLVRGGSIVVALPAVAGVVLILSPFVRRLVMQRFFELINLEAGTGSARLIMWRAFLRDAERSPLFGHGAASYRDISEHLGVQGTVSENFVVEIFHAGGAVAVLLLLTALIAIGVRCLLAPGADRRPSHTAACLTGAAALVMASTTNPAAWNGLFWVLLALAASRPPFDEVVPDATVIRVKAGGVATKRAVAQ